MHPGEGTVCAACGAPLEQPPVGGARIPVGLIPRWVDLPHGDPSAAVEFLCADCWPPRRPRGT